MDQIRVVRHRGNTARRGGSGFDCVVSMHDLTPRECTVVAVYMNRWLAGDDTSDAALAAQLVIVDETVKDHMRAIRRKWDCKDRHDIIRRAFFAGRLPTGVGSQSG